MCVLEITRIHLIFRRNITLHLSKLKNLLETNKNQRKEHFIRLQFVRIKKKSEFDFVYKKMWCTCELRLSFEMSVAFANAYEGKHQNDASSSAKELTRFVR